MNEGKKILLDIISKKEDKLIDYQGKRVVYNDVDLMDLYNSLNKSVNNLSEVSNQLIDTIIKENKYEIHILFHSKIVQLRDLYIGKRDYNLKIKMNKEFEDNFNIFKNLIKNIIERDCPGAFDIHDEKSKLNELKDKVNKNEIIDNTDYVINLLKEMDSVQFDSNMFKVMMYINVNNSNILSNQIEDDKIKLKNIIDKEIDKEILDIIDKLKINLDDIPNDLIYELKNVDKNEFINKYNLIKNNKVEKYGILHLINNNISKIVILLYSSEEAIKNIVDSTRDKNNNININNLKIIINNICDVFVCKKNNYIICKYDDYINNIKLLDELNVKKDSMINKNPLFLISNNELVNYSLNYCNKYGANKKKLINKCYKTLSINPSIIVDNIDVLNKYNVDLNDFFSDNNSNYNLLKVSDLDIKLKYLINKYDLDSNNLDYKSVYKLLLNKIFDDIKNNKDVSWGDIDA